MQKNILPKLEKIVGCKRPSCKCRQWEGNQIHKILKEKNLAKMEELLPEEFNVV